MPNAGKRSIWMSGGQSRIFISPIASKPYRLDNFLSSDPGDFLG